MASTTSLIPAMQESLDTCRFLDLAHEIRNVIYIYHLAHHPSVTLPTPDSTILVARAALTLVNKQLRSELSGVVKYYATHLNIPTNISGLGDLVRTTQRFDQQTLVALSSASTRAKPSPSQLIAAQRAQTLRPCHSLTLAANLRQFVGLTTLVIELSTISENKWTESVFITRWTEQLYGNNRAFWEFRALNFEVRFTTDSKEENMGVVVGGLIWRARTHAGRRWLNSRLARIFPQGYEVGGEDGRPGGGWVMAGSSR